MQNLSMGGSRFPRTLILAALLGLLAVSCGNPPSVAPEKAPDRRSLQDEQQRFGTASLILPSGRSFPIKLVFSAEEHTKGLSGVRPEDFPDDMGMFFWFSQSGPRRFWMPDTWFDLDIIFLDENLTIVHVAKNMKAHPGRQTPPPIAMTPVVFARHVLEVKANGPLSRELQEGARLQWRAPPHSLR
uniref:Uncharacterized conserved membrane protein, UPF0127 family n=1 Tax=Candidatus Kentrum sp. DK TaxID=2126562 RepID=A0A450SBQ1_9GAMM|nr:MAG: Uncharacterized conserved membrane protein, UPF0127 family [Candidatus Kentron sp. DK]